MKNSLFSLSLLGWITAAGAQDFGDAPHCYPVLFAQNGARHAASALRLGPNKSNEADGRPNGASRDPAEEPTDDGVLLPSLLHAGQIEMIDVGVSANSRLDAWVDWNHDGDWSDAGERIFTAQPVLTGANSLGFTVPSELVAGDSVARFRLSLAGGLAPTGFAPEGEVEDYPVKMVALPSPPPVLNDDPAQALSFSVVGTPGTTGAVWTFAWQGDSAHFAAISHSYDLTTWNSLAHPVGTPAAAGPQSLVIEPYRAPYLMGSRGYFRLSRGTLSTPSLIPCFPGLHRQLHFVSGGLDRTYNLFIPPTYQPGLSLPLVFMLHGGGQSADSFLDNRHGEFTAAAAAEQMIVCFPDATRTVNGTNWSSEDDDANPTTPGVDDVAFLDALRTALQTALGADPLRKYIGGFSDGGVMANFMAARSSHVFSALAVCGSAIGTSPGLGSPVVLNPPVPQPVPVLTISLADDGRRLFLGKPPGDPRPLTSVAQFPEYWVVQNGLGTAPPQANGLPAIAPVQVQVNFTRPMGAPGFSQYEQVDPGPVVRTAYPHLIVGGQVTGTTITTATWQVPVGVTTNEVILVVLSDGGHEWPDAATELGFDANTKVFAFFARH